MKVSVVMAVFNTKDFLEESIKSILSQSLHEFEFIIVDDYSTDGSYELLQDFALQDKRIQLYRNKKNEGISFTRKKLISLTNTNFIAIQDSDDVSSLNRLELQYNFLVTNLDYSAVSSNNFIINEESQKIGKRIYSQDISYTILKKSPLSNPGTMFRKDVFLKLGGYESGLNYGEDYDLWLKMYLHGYKLGILPDCLLSLRIRAGQTKSSNLKDTLKNTISLQLKYIKLGLKPSISDRIYIFLEKILSFFPSTIILFLFKKLEYKNEN